MHKNLLTYLAAVFAAAASCSRAPVRACALTESSCLAGELPYCRWALAVVTSSSSPVPCSSPLCRGVKVKILGMIYLVARPLQTYLVTGSDNYFEGLGLARATIFGRDGRPPPVLDTPARPPRERQPGCFGLALARRVRSECVLVHVSDAGTGFVDVVGHTVP